MGKLMGFFKSSDDATVEEPRAHKPASTRKVHQSKENVNKDMYEIIPDRPPPYPTAPRFTPHLYGPGCCRYRPGVVVTRDKRTDQVRADWVSSDAEQIVQSIYRNAPTEVEEDYANGSVRFLTSTLSPPSMTPTPTLRRRRLPHPVFIPQRKPENRGPGWMTAYPPVLDDCGIDEKTFLAFLEDFNEICESSPDFDAVNLATMDVRLEPGTNPMVVSIDVPAAVIYAKATQTEQQKSLFLSLANSQLFEPRGLFALVTTFSPDQPSNVVQVDISSPPNRTAEGVQSRRASSTPRGGCPADTTYIVKGTRGRALKSELLYLMVVCRPTDAEVTAAATAGCYNTSPTAGTRMSPQSLPRIDTLQIVLKMRDVRQDGD